MTTIKQPGTKVYIDNEEHIIDDDEAFRKLLELHSEKNNVSVVRINGLRKRLFAWVKILKDDN